MTDWSTAPAGPELDRAVADACGVTYVPADPDRPLADLTPRQLAILGNPHVFSPSTDMRDAMRTAEQFDLFNPLVGIVLGRDGDGSTYWWVVFDWHAESVNPGHMRPVATGPTPELAICRAIMALYEQRQ